MVIDIKHYKGDLPVKHHPVMDRIFLDRNLFFFHQLSDTAKNNAMLTIIESARSANRRNISIAKKKYLENKHTAINDRYHITRIYNDASALRKINTYGVDYIVRFIVSNFCMFNVQGDLYSIISDCCHSANYYRQSYTPL
jgi:hypothetical protein